MHFISVGLSRTAREKQPTEVRLSRFGSEKDHSEKDRKIQTPRFICGVWWSSVERSRHRDLWCVKFPRRERPLFVESWIAGERRGLEFVATRRLLCRGLLCVAGSRKGWGFCYKMKTRALGHLLQLKDHRSPTPCQPVQPVST